MSISVNKQERKQDEKTVKRKLDEMSEEMEDIFRELSKDPQKYDKDKVFDQVQAYVEKYDKFLYSDISNYIFRISSDEEVDTFQSNLVLVLEYVLSEEYDSKIKTEEGEKAQKLEKVRRVILKIYDHANLARRQYTELKESDEEFGKRFEKSFINHQVEITKEMSSQLITLIGIFTAVAFVVFGGISSLDNIFQAGVKDIPLLKLMITGTLWGLCMINLVYIFLFCVGKISKISIKSSEKKGSNLVQKYPIIFWSNLMLLSLLLLESWTYFLNNHGYLNWIHEMMRKTDAILSIMGFVIIIIMISLGAYILTYLNKKEIKDD